ncbi:DUF2871 domain-containing protein [Clostridium hydrogeniformans]|uniref:DUF2871 domain-containing protein n=1 Tax=Clostridium hydrogeniformans TaxID=349933 RepID=UPI000482E959|nr:DUF2871 domain-containing protein [Clostridium hydrogeniformans]
MKKLFNACFFYLVLGMASGVFAREFMKFNEFTGSTNLTTVHPHLFTLGFIFFLILTLGSSSLDLTKNKNFNKWFILYNISLLWTCASLTMRGILQVNGSDFKGLSHISGTGHALLGISLIWFMIILKSTLTAKEK